MGVHDLIREDLGDFWRHRGGQYRTVTGLEYAARAPSYPVRLEMWVPGADMMGD